MTAMNLNRAIRGPVTAVPVVAGKGVRIVPDVENNRFVVEADETVLWDGNGTPSASVQLNESISNFERIKVLIGSYDNAAYSLTYQEFTPTIGNHIWTLVLGLGEANAWISLVQLRENSGTITSPSIKRLNWGSFSANTTSVSATVETDPKVIYKVVGINRIANN